MYTPLLKTIARDIINKDLPKSCLVHRVLYVSYVRFLLCSSMDVYAGFLSRSSCILVHTEHLLVFAHSISNHSSPYNGHISLSMLALSSLTQGLNNQIIT